MNATQAAIDLDDTEGLLSADRDGLLRAASMAGAHVRAVAAAVDEGALDSLGGDDRAAHGDLGCRTRHRRDRGRHACRDVRRLAGAPIVLAAEAPAVDRPAGRGDRGR